MTIAGSVIADSPATVNSPSVESSAESPVESTLQRPPNIVLILADDLGYGELGCFGQTKIKTPHLDRLAAQGLRLTQHYSGAPTCAPSRCVLLTGQHLAHAQIRGNKDSGNGRPFPGQWPLEPDTLTMARALQQAGYRTGGFGKWGLGPTDSTGSPLRQGFDRFFGYNCQRNAHSYFPPYLDSDEQQVSINDPAIPGHQKQLVGEVLAETYRGKNYAPDLILAESLHWLDANHREPFFLYLPFVEPHVSMQPPQVWLDEYPADWDRENGVYRGENGYLPHPRPRAAYAAMISDLDEHVGAILARLEHWGVAENTLVIFTSDNGPTHGGQDPRFQVGGAGVSFFNSTAGLRGAKGSCFEGGLRVPTIVRWPGVISPGGQSDFPSYFPDWFATIVEVAELKSPAAAKLDGVSLQSVWNENKSPARTAPLIWEFAEYGGIVAIRDGDWKAIRRDLNKPQALPWELYNIANDPQEKINLAAKHPDVVHSLEQRYLETRSREPDFLNRVYDAEPPAKSTAILPVERAIVGAFESAPKGGR